MTKPLIIDAREDFEFKDGHVDQAINISPMRFMTGEVPVELNNIDKSDPIIVYCRTGSRSNVVVNILGDLGFTNVTNGINQGHVEKML